MLIKEGCFDDGIELREHPDQNVREFYDMLGRGCPRLIEQLREDFSLPIETHKVITESSSVMWRHQ